MPEQPIFESPQEEPELPTQEKTIEQRLLEKRSALEGLVERLGFKETPEMVLLRRSIGMPDGIDVDNLNAWRDQAESMVESSAKGEEFVRA